ncbi:hypothetical protein ACWCQB_33695, partial [Streptomyces hirsutus]
MARSRFAAVALRRDRTRMSSTVPSWSCAARKVIGAGGSDAVRPWDYVRVIVSLLYRVARRLLSVPSVLLRRDTAKDA